MTFPTECPPLVAYAPAPWAEPLVGVESPNRSCRRPSPRITSPLRYGIDERAGRATRFRIFPLWIQVPKLRLILFLAQIIDQVVAVVANEDFVLFDGLDKRLHPARSRFNRQADGVRRQNHPDLTLLHILKQLSKRLTALSKLLIIGEMPQLAIVLRRINRCLAAVVHML